MLWTECCAEFVNNKITPDPTNIYLFKVNSRNARERCEINSKLSIKTSEWCQWRHSGVFIVNFEHISHFFLVFVFLTLNWKMFFGEWRQLTKAATGVILWKKGVFKNFANFTGKQLCWGLFLIKFYRTSFKNTYFEEHLRTTTSELRWFGVSIVKSESI